MNHSICADFGSIILKPLTHSDIEQLRLWRNDETISKYLREIGHISAQQQECWFENYLRNNTEIAWGIYDRDLSDEELIGSISLYDICEQNSTAVIGHFLIGSPQAHLRDIGRKSIVMTVKIGHDIINVSKYCATVHPDNIASMKCFKKAGFKDLNRVITSVGQEKLLGTNAIDVRRFNDFYDDIVTFKTDKETDYE